jgi:predicted small metal-binding protein
LTRARSGGRVAGVTDWREDDGFSIRCADAGVDCPGYFTTETKEELMKHVELHANEAHPDLDLQPEHIEALVQSSA